jgi:hypothetical protein
MPEESRQITDDMLLSELTVGEFKTLMQELLSQTKTPQKPESKIEPPIEKVKLRRKSLDEFMNDLGDSK